MLPFYHAEKPFQDFLIFACNEKSYLSDIQAIAEKSTELAYTLKKLALYGDIGVYSWLKSENDIQNIKLLFSGYLLHKGALHFGQKEIDECGITPEQLASADGYFTFAYCTDEATTITQDSFGREIIFHYLHNDIAVISNRYHLLLLFLTSLKVPLKLNYDTILCILCSHTQIYQQNVTRDMPIEGIQQMPMTDYVEISATGWRIKKKKELEKIFLPTDKSQHLFEKGLEEIHESSKAIFTRAFSDGLKVDVTGGYDSRICVSALLGLGFRNFACRTTSNVNSNADVLVGSMIAQKFGLAQCDPLFYPRELWPFFDDAFAVQRSLTLGSTYQLCFGSTRIAPGADCLLVTGDWAEVYKPYYSKAYVPHHIFTNISLNVLVDEFVLKNTSIYHDNIKLLSRLQEIVHKELALLPGERPQEKLNNHLPFYRMRAHFGLSNLCKVAYCGYRWAPAISQSMWAYCNSIPYDERNTPHHYQASINIANALCPQMAKIPYAAPGEIAKLELYGCDMTAEYQVDTSSWQVLKKKSSEKSGLWFVEAVKQGGYAGCEFGFAWQHNQAKRVIQVFSTFDSLRQYSSELGELFNDTLRTWLAANSTNQHIIDSYLIKLTSIHDQLEIIGHIIDNKNYPMHLISDEIKSISFVKLDFIPTTSLIHHYIKYSDDIMDGKITLPSGEIISARPYCDLFTHVFENDIEENYLFIKGLEWIEALLFTYEKTGDLKYWKEAEGAIEIFLHYVSNDIENKLKIPSSVEHGYAARVFTFSKALQMASENSGWIAKLLHVLVQHGEWLSDIKNRRLNNHDVMTNFALIHLTMLLRGVPQVSQWRQIALSRLEELLDLNFDSDGMNNENSPSYHHFNITLFSRILHYLQHYNIDCHLTFKAELVLKKATMCMRHIVHQDNTCPNIGDSSLYATPFESINASSFYKNAGLSIIKDNDIYLSFKCGFGLESHKHHDETGITLRYKGRDIFVDGGRFSYDSKHPIRQYMVSPKAHSAIYPIHMDESGIRKIREKYREAGLLHFTEQGEFTSISGGYTLQDNTWVNRHIFRHGTVLQITDTWECSTPQDMRQRFLLGPGMQTVKHVHSGQSALYHFVNDNIMIEIDIYMPHDCFLSNIEGGLYSPITYETLDVLCLNSIHQNSTKASFITQIRLSCLS